MTAPMPVEKPSCLNCPSYVEAVDSVRFFKKSISAPMCSRYGHVLGKPKAKANQLRKIAEDRAAGCPSFGQPPVKTPEDYKLQVTIPTLEHEGEYSADVPGIGSSTLRVSSCGSCVNFVRDDVVMENLGWNAGLCRSKGKLILANRHVVESHNCDYKLFGTPANRVSDLTLLPELEDAFGELNPITEYFKKKSAFVDPNEYPTDEEVLEEDAKRGIRAWRSVKNTEDGRTVLLPVFDEAMFDDEQLATIPRTGDDEHPELYVDHANLVYRTMVLWRHLDETPAYWGQAGVGKTELLRHIAWLMHVPFIRISITRSTEIDDLAGKMNYSPERGTYFEYGRLPRAWGRPGVICLDEPNVGMPEVWQFIRPLTDNSKQMVLDQSNNHERITRHRDCYLGMCMNPSWDPRNTGAEVIGDADGSRLMHIFMELPPEPLERAIIVDRVKEDGWEIDKVQLDTIMRIAADIRDLCENLTLPITWGIRPQIKVARALRYFPIQQAYKIAAADYLEPDAKTAMMDVVISHAGE